MWKVKVIITAQQLIENIVNKSYKNKTGRQKTYEITAKDPLNFAG